MATISAVSEASGHAELAIGNQPGPTRHPFWPRPPLDPLAFDRSYPFQLLVVRKVKDTYRVDARWRFTLPIPPQSLQYTRRGSTGLTVNSGGSVEQASGHPGPWSVSLAGSFGVLPLREEVKRAGNAGGVFGGVLQAAETLSSALTGEEAPAALLRHSDADIKGYIGYVSGHIQRQVLVTFFESYAALRGTEAGRDARLLFADWKRGEVCLAKMEQLSLPKDVGSPLEERFSLALTLFRRVTIDVSLRPVEAVQDGPTRPESKLAAVVDAVAGVRDLLVGSRGVLDAAVADVDAVVLEPIRQASLFASDQLGAAVTLLDLPAQLARRCSGALMGLLSVRDQARRFPVNVAAGAGATADAFEQLRQVAARLGLAASGAGVARGASDGNAMLSAGADPLRRPGLYPELFGLVRVADLDLPLDVAAAIAQERGRAQRQTAADFTAAAADLRAAGDALADHLGAGNAEYDRTRRRFGKPAARRPRLADWRLYHALGRAEVALRVLAQEVSSGRVAEVRGRFAEAVAAGVPVRMPEGKSLVPVVNGSIRDTADRYLRDPDRWPEIVLLNDLREPLVDDIGVFVPLAAPSDTAAFFVADRANFLAGRPCRLDSPKRPPLLAVVIAVDRLSPSLWRVSVKADEPLVGFQPRDGATAWARAPGTVGSEGYVWVSAELNAVPLDQTAGPSDLLLLPDDDLYLDPEGGTPSVGGAAAIIQAARVELRTPRGRLRRWPRYGFPVQPGQPLASLDPGAMAAEARDMLAYDDRGAAIGGAQVVLRDGVAAVARLLLLLPAHAQSVSVDFDLP